MLEQYSISIAPKSEKNKRKNNFNILTFRKKYYIIIMSGIFNGYYSADCTQEIVPCSAITRKK